MSIGFAAYQNLIWSICWPLSVVLAWTCQAWSGELGRADCLYSRKDADCAACRYPASSCLTFLSPPDKMSTGEVTPLPSQARPFSNEPIRQESRYNKAGMSYSCERFVLLALNGIIMSLYMMILKFVTHSLTHSLSDHAMPFSELLSQLKINETELIWPRFTRSAFCNMQSSIWGPLSASLSVWSRNWGRI